MRLSFLHFMIWMSLSALPAGAQVVEHEQHAFPENIPAGGYSGITWLGDNRYAVVSDNTAREGFFLFNIKLNSKGDIVSAKNLGFKGNKGRGRDNEGIAWCKKKNTIFVTRESDNQVVELSMTGKPTGRKLAVPKVFEGTTKVYGFEALTYNAATHRFWITSESTLNGDGKRATASNGVRNALRLQSFNDNLKPVAHYWYLMDKPESRTEQQLQNFAMGVSALTALDDGRLLVLEREFAVPEAKLGAFVNCKIYEVNPQKNRVSSSKRPKKEEDFLQKKLVAEWTTAIGLLDFSIANYEGMCLGPKLADGGQVIVLIADSQNQYAGILSDWLKTIVIY